MKPPAPVGRFAVLLSITAIFTGAMSLAAPPDSSRPAVGRDVWEAVFIEGARVGYTEVSIRPVQRSGVPLLQIDGHNHVSMRRSGTLIEMDVRFKSTETPAGRLVDFSSDISSTPMASQGRVDGQRLQLETTTKGMTQHTSVPWPADGGGIYAVENSLRRQPMKPGQHRTIRTWDLGTNQLATEELAAGDYEPVKLLSGAATLLRIDRVTRLGPATFKGTIWTDRRGEPLKESSELLGMEAYRTSKEVALGAVEPVDLDQILKATVALDRSLDRPHETRRVRYRVRLEGGDPASVFASGPSQQVRSIDAHTAEVTVYAIRPNDRSGNSQAAGDPPTKADREPNNLIQSDNPKIAAQAREIAADEKDPWKVCVALESWVHHWIIKPDYTQALDSAADVMESRQGDCTEYSVLLAALARARGIPARVAIGLVYVNRSFMYHMWDEVYLSGRWIPIDATLARGGIGAAHLKIAHSNFAGASPYSSILPVAQVAGRLKIEVLEVEEGIRD